MDTIVISELLPQLGVLLQRMRDRVAGRIPGKTLHPHNAAQHAAAVLRVLGVGEVQAELHGPQHVQELAAAVQAAQQEFEAMARGVTEIATQDHNQQQQQPQTAAAAATAPDAATAAAAAAAAGSIGGVSGPSETAPSAARLGKQQGQTRKSLTVAELQSAVQASRTITSNNKGKLSRTLNKLLRLVHGPRADASAVQAADLLQQWPTLHAYLLQRLQSDNSTNRMSPATALTCYVYGMRQLLVMPLVQQQLDSQALQQLRQQMEADAARYKLLPARGTAGGNLVPAPSALGVQPAAAATASHQKCKFRLSTGTYEQKRTGAPRARDGGFVIDGSSVPNTEPASSDGNNSDLSREELAAGPSVAWADGRAATPGRPSKRVKEVTGSAAAVTKAATTEAPEGTAAGAGDGMECALTVPAITAGAMAAAAAAAAAEGPVALAEATAAAGDGSDMECDPLAQRTSPSASGLTLEKLAARMQRRCRADTLRKRLAPLRSLATLLYGSSYDPAAVTVAEPLQHWHLYEQQLLQQVAGTHATLPSLAAATAHGLAVHAAAWAREPLVQSELTEQELQEFLTRVAATKAAIADAARTTDTASESADTQDQQPSASGGLEPAGPAMAQGDSGVTLVDGLGSSPLSATEVGHDSTAAAAVAAPAPATPAAVQALIDDMPTATQDRLSDSEPGQTNGASAPATAGATSGSGLSLEQLIQHLKRQQQKRKDSTRLTVLVPLRALAKLVHGSGYDASAVQVAELLQQWDRLSQQFLQRLTCADESLPHLSCLTAKNYASCILQLLQRPLVRAQLSQEDLQDIQQKITASKAAFEAAAPPPAAVQMAGPSSGVQQLQPVVAPGSQPTSAADLIAAQRQLLWLYDQKLQPEPSLAEKVGFRSCMRTLSRLPAGDIRLAKFWADYDVSDGGFGWG
jgi:hypothetical protein